MNPRFMRLGQLQGVLPEEQIFGRGTLNTEELDKDKQSVNTRHLLMLPKN